jgi:hypothetical protein
MTTHRIAPLVALALILVSVPGGLRAQKASEVPPYLTTSGDSVNVFVSADLYQELRKAAPGVTIANVDVRPTPRSAPDGFASESPTEGDPGSTKAKLSLERAGGQPAGLALITAPNHGFRFKFDKGAGRWRTTSF